MKNTNQNIPIIIGGITILVVLVAGVMLVKSFFVDAPTEAAIALPVITPEPAPEVAPAH